MAMTLDAVVSLANQTARDSQYGASSIMRESEQALGRATADKRRKDEIIASRANQSQGKSEFDKEANSVPISAPQASAEIKRRMSPVDPAAQTSLLMLLPKEEQDYATLTYQILADQRGMS